MAYVPLAELTSVFIGDYNRLVEVGREFELGFFEGHKLVFKRGPEAHQLDLHEMTRYSKAEENWENGTPFTIYKLEFDQASIIILAESHCHTKIDMYIGDFFHKFYKDIPYEMIEFWYGKTFESFLLILKYEFGLDFSFRKALAANGSVSTKKATTFRDILSMFSHASPATAVLSSPEVFVSKSAFEDYQNRRNKNQEEAEVKHLDKENIAQDV